MINVGPDAAAVDQVLSALQSADNSSRRQAEAQLDAWSQSPGLLTALMTRTHLAATAGSRQLAASVLSWRLPKIWAGLQEADQSMVQSSLLECFSKCTEMPVLRALAEACNALCQTIALHRNILWEDLVRLISALLRSDVVIHRRGALELLSSLVDSLGARLQGYYPDIGATLAALVRDADADVRVAALGALGTLATSWCRNEADVATWKSAGDATLEAAAASLTSGSKDGPKVLVASLRALARITPALHSEALARAAIELVCRVLSAGNAPEHCCVQALQLLRVLVRRVPELIGEAGFVAAVPVVCKATKDMAPAVDDLDEVSSSALAARDCLRVLARASPTHVVPVVFELARSASESRDAVDRAAAVHMVAFTLCGAREAPPNWAMLLCRALADPAVWVRQAACEGASALAEALQTCPVTTEGLLLLLGAFAERLPLEKEIELVRKIADATASIFRELTTDEVVGVLRNVVQALLQSLPPVAAAGSRSDCPADEAAAAMTAATALASALAAAASTAADHFAPLVNATAAILLPLLRAGARPNCRGTGVALLSPAAYAACLDAAGGLVASAWTEASFQATRDELAAIAQQVLVNPQASSEVHASAHSFFACVALASFEEFAPYLGQVVPPAVNVLHTSDGSEVDVGTRRRAVRTGVEDERVAAIDALGSYAAAVGSRFGEFMPTALPAVCAQATHASPGVRAAAARTLCRLGSCLGDMASRLPLGPSPDRSAAAAMAQAIAQALCSLIVASQSDNTALRCGLQAREDLMDCGTFAPLAGQEIIAAMNSAGVPAQRSEDVESSAAGDEEADDAEEDS